MNQWEAENVRRGWKLGDTYKYYMDNDPCSCQEALNSPS